MTAPIPSPIWQPAASRVIPISAPANLRTRGLVPEIVTLSWAPKSSADHFDFSLDLSEVLSCTGDFVASVSASVPTATGSTDDLVALWTSIVNGLACVFLGSGPPGTTQTVRVTVGTQQGRVITQDVALAINLYSPATPPQPAPALTDGTPVPPNAMQLPGGGILTLGGSKTQVISAQRIMTPDGVCHLITPDGRPLLDVIYQAYTDILLIA